MKSWESELLIPHGQPLLMRAHLTQAALDVCQATGLRPDKTMAIVLSRFDQALAGMQERRDAAYPIVAATMTPDVEREALAMAEAVLAHVADDAF